MKVLGFFAVFVCCFDCVNNFMFIIWVLASYGVNLSWLILLSHYYIIRITCKPGPFPLPHVYPFFSVCVWSDRGRTVRRWWACCQERSWVRKVSSCQSLCLRSTCPGCGWRNTLIRTARSVCLSVYLPLLPSLCFSFNNISLSSLGQHVGFLPRLWSQLLFSVWWSRPVGGHIWVDEGRAAPHGPETRPAGPQSPRPQTQNQRHFLWHRSVFVLFVYIVICV